MTPTPREDTMTEQTEQEPMDPWESLRKDVEVLRDAAKRIEDGTDADDILRWLWRGKSIAYETVLGAMKRLDAAHAADAAQVRERDAQIANQAAEIQRLRDQEMKAWEENRKADAMTIARFSSIIVDQAKSLAAMREQIARLSAQVEELERKNAEQAEHLGRMLSNRYDADNATLRAERDAAQPQIATLAEALDAEIAVLEQEASDRMGAERDAEQAASPERANYSKGRRLATELCVSRLYDLKRAALQSTRPQEQP